MHLYTGWSADVSHILNGHNFLWGCHNWMVDHTFWSLDFTILSIKEIGSGCAISSEIQLLEEGIQFLFSHFWGFLWTMIIEGLIPNTQKQFWYPWDSATFGTKIFEFRESRFFPKPCTSWVEKWPKILYLQIPKRWLKNVFWPFFELLSSFLGQPFI